MITNLDIWRYSLEYPEPILDPYYEKEGTLILSVDPLNPTKVMIKNRELHEYISAYGVAKRTKNNVSEREILEYTLEIILSCPELNCSEFVSFWSVVDVSYSFFTSIKNKQEQITVLQNLLDAYLNDRY